MRSGTMVMAAPIDSRSSAHSRVKAPRQVIDVRGGAFTVPGFYAADARASLLAHGKNFIYLTTDLERIK